LEDGLQVHLDSAEALPAANRPTAWKFFGDFV
jgi:hypothetical protein